MLIALRTLVLLGWFFVTFSLTLLLLSAIPVFTQLKKTLKALEEITYTVQHEIKPALQNTAHSIESMGNLADHMNRKIEMTTGFLDLLNPLHTATHQAKSYLYRVAKAPKAEMAGLVAGIKKALEIAKSRLNTIGKEG